MSLLKLRNILLPVVLVWIAAYEFRIFLIILGVFRHFLANNGAPNNLTKIELKKVSKIRSQFGKQSKILFHETLLWNFSSFNEGSRTLVTLTYSTRRKCWWWFQTWALCKYIAWYVMHGTGSLGMSAFATHFLDRLYHRIPTVHCIFSIVSPFYTVSISY